MSVDNLAVSGPNAFPDRTWDSLQFRAIFAIAFVFHLTAAIAFAFHLTAAIGARLTLGHWRDGWAHRSIFAEAWSASGTTAQIAFSG